MCDGRSRRTRTAEAHGHGQKESMWDGRMDENRAALLLSQWDETCSRHGLRQYPSVRLQDVVRQPALTAAISRESDLGRRNDMSRQITGKIDPAVCASCGKPVVTNPAAQLTHRYDSNHRRSPFARIRFLRRQAGITFSLFGPSAYANHPDSKPVRHPIPGASSARDQRSCV